MMAAREQFCLNELSVIASVIRSHACCGMSETVSSFVLYDDRAILVCATGFDPRSFRSSSRINHLMVRLRPIGKTRILQTRTSSSRCRIPWRPQTHLTRDAPPAPAFGRGKMTRLSFGPRKNHWSVCLLARRGFVVRTHRRIERFTSSPGIRGTSSFSIGCSWAT
jgi:hypothetical protein